MFRMIKEAITFQKEGSWANLSRVDPALISTGKGFNYFFGLSSQGSKFMKFISVGLVGACHLYEPHAIANNRFRKQISIALFGGEHERFIGAMGMITNQERYGLSLVGDYVEFSTTMSMPGGDLRGTFITSVTLLAN